MTTEPESDAGSSPKKPTDNPPQTFNDESNQTAPKENEQTESASPPQSAQPPPSEESGQGKMSAWVRRAKSAGVWAWKLFAELVTILWILALWDSYRPKITVTPGPTLDPKAPFATAFIVQNQGALPIRDISFDTTWVYGDEQSPAYNVVTGLNKIKELKPLEQHILAAVLAIVDTNKMKLPKSVEVVPMPIKQHSLILTFQVTYSPQFFGKRTTTICFFGLWDSQTNFVWVPTGSIDIRTESVDAELVKKANELADSIVAKQKGSHAIPLMPPNVKTPATSNSVQTTNKGAQVHTNSGSPK